MSIDATKQHVVRAVFDIAFLKELAEHHHLIYDEKSKKVYGLEAGVRRLYEWQRDRIAKDIEVLYPKTRPRDPPTPPTPVPAKQLLDMSPMKDFNNVLGE